MRKLTNGFIALFLLFLSFDGLSQVATSTQNQPTETRTFDAEKLSDYREDGRFEYQVYKAKPKSFLERVWDQITSWFFSIFGSSITSGLLEILFYVLIIVAFIYFIIKLTGIETSAILKKAGAQARPYQVDEEALEDIDFEQEIQAAISQHQWRIAVRLMYLNALKKISDANLIAIRKGKTNHEYLYELSGHKVEKDFASLSFLFDYTWYGHFDANEAIVNKASLHLKGISNLKSGEK